MDTNYETLEPPIDAIEVGHWTLDADGYGRFFRGSVHGVARIYGWQKADGSVHRSIHLDTREWDNPFTARQAAQDVLDAAGEVTGLEALR